MSGFGFRTNHSPPSHEFANNVTELSAAAAIQIRTTLLTDPAPPLPARKFPLKLTASGPCLAFTSCRAGAPDPSQPEQPDPGGERGAHRSPAGPACACLPFAGGAQRREPGAARGQACPSHAAGSFREEPLPVQGGEGPALAAAGLSAPPEPPRTAPGAGPPRVYQHGRSRRWQERDGALSLSRRTALGSGGMARGLLPLLLVVVLIIETQCKNDTEALIHIAYNKLITTKIIAKREIQCNRDEYILGVKCCKKCERGFVKNMDCPTDISEHCVPCENGKEYMDHVNDLEKCLRCASCDRTFGFEVAKNCTPTQNTECVCAKNYFCNSSLPCMHCDECTVCKSGIIEKQCTSTSDTVCGMEDNKQRCHTSRENPGEVVPSEAPYENVPLIYPDVDLSSHVAAIVEEMTLQEVKTFVRNHKVPEPVIDQTVRDHVNDTSEQKIKLFQVWYQRHGIKGAYETLISSLREFKMCAVADKIERKLKAAVSSSQEGRQSYTDDTEQSKTCTQESRNSYNDSDELSKTCSVSLEVT
ncbi:tumor necrosis factor receptor superfamily member 6 [Aegotheles albertisi]